MIKQFVKYTFVCDPNECDALLEFTARDGFGFPNGETKITCPCGRQMQYISANIEEQQQQEEVPSMETIVNATEDFLKSQIAQKDERIAQLEEHIQKVTQRSYADSADKNRLIDSMKDWTLEQLEQGDISEIQAEDIANICGFELTNEFEAEVTVMYSITVNARNEEEAQNAIHDIDFDSVSYNDDSITYLSGSVDRIEI